MADTWSARYDTRPPGQDAVTPGSAGAQSVYDYWLSLLPQFWAQLGAPLGAAGATGAHAAALPFPADQVAKAAALTQGALQGIADSYAPMLQAAGAPGLLEQWARTYATAFDRTYGALGDALGLGPMRKLQAAAAQLMAAAQTQNESRAAYAMLVQSAFASGLDELLRRLAQMAERGERVDSVLVLLRMWASATEQVVHHVLQSERGVAATAALTRAALGYRKQLQAVAAVIADALDMATREDLDEAYREIQQLKRELRALRAAPAPPARGAKPRARRSTRKTQS